MASNFITIDASSMTSVDYATYLAGYFAAQGTTRGAATYYDSTFYASVGGYYSGSQVGVRYASSTNNAQVLLEGADMQYDGVAGQHGSYSGSVDSVAFGYYDANTMSVENGSQRSTLIGAIEELVVSGLDISEAVGAGAGIDNDYYQLLTAIRDANSATIAEGNTLTNGEFAIQRLYEMLAARAQHFIGSDGGDTYVGTRFGDRIDGGAGVDTLSGGSGKDVFVFDLGDSAADAANADVILDFNAKKDRIDLSAIDANLVKDGDQALKFFGTGELGAKAGVRYDEVGDQTHVSIDADGDATADMLIILEGSAKLTADHFIL